MLVDITHDILYTTKYAKYIAITLMIVSLVQIIRYIIIIRRKKLDILESMNKNEQLPLIIDFYYKHLYLYTFCLFFSLFDYFIIIKDGTI